MPLSDALNGALNNENRCNRKLQQKHEGQKNAEQRTLPSIAPISAFVAALWSFGDPENRRDATGAEKSLLSIFLSLIFLLLVSNQIRTLP